MIDTTENKIKDVDNKVTELSEEDLANVVGGMKIIIQKNNKFMKKILDLIYKIKKKTK